MTREYHNTAHKRCQLNLDIWSPVQTYIAVTGADSLNHGAEYFSRLCHLKAGVNRFEFPMPQSPEVLEVSMVFMRNSNQAEIHYQSSLGQIPWPLPRFKPQLAEFVNFAAGFAKVVTKLPVKGESSDGIYTSSTGKYRIEYLPHLIECDKKNRCRKSKTPARIHKITNIIEVNREQLGGLTIPNIMCILFHEYSHNYANVNMDSEIEADANGLNIYFQLSYPVIEAFYAFSTVFPEDTPEAIERLELAYQLLDRLERKRAAADLERGLSDLKKWKGAQYG